MIEWELYHTDVDFTQSNDLAAKNPEKLKELIGALGRRGEEVRRPAARRPPVRAGRRSRPGRSRRSPKKQYTFYPGTSILHPLAAPQMLGVEHTITAHVEIPEDGAEGVLAVQRRRVRRLDAVPQGRQVPLRPQLPEARAVRGGVRRGRAARASTR